jgi:hypothetical protein
MESLVLQILNLRNRERSEASQPANRCCEIERAPDGRRGVRQGSPEW